MGLVAICFLHVYEFQVFLETAFTEVLRIPPPFFFFYKSDLRTAFYHDWQCGSQCFKKVQANTRESFVLLGNIDLFVR